MRIDPRKSRLVFACLPLRLWGAMSLAGGILLLFTAVSATGGQTAASPPSVVISAIANEQTHAIAKLVLQEAYRRIGYGVCFDDLPGKRALEWANNGLTDGDAARIEGTEKKYTNLVPVKIPVIHFNGVAFTKAVDKPIRQWADLRGLRIGVVRGIRYSTIGTEGMAPYFANDMTHLFTLLEEGRIEVAVAVEDAGRIEIHRHFQNRGIHVIGSPLFSAPLYHFVHIRNRSLVDPLEAVLSRMAASGEIQRLRDQALKQLTSDEIP